MDSFTIFLLLSIAVAVTTLFLRRWRYYPLGFTNPRPTRNVEMVSA